VNILGIVIPVLKRILRDILMFCEDASKLRLRHYQEEVAQAIIRSVISKAGDTIVVLFPRQSGKNELQAQVETYLLTLFSQTDAEMVKISPTWKPQALNAMRRLERVLNRNAITESLWKKESGHIYRVCTSRITFLSGSPETSIVGATASILLEVDEAQDVLISKYDKDIAPMAASTNATRVFWGTAWTSKTLLARELRSARAAELRDGRRRVFIMTADDVAREVPAYGAFVDDQVFKLGRQHPMVRTQFYSEEIDAESGMFPARRQALMVGSHNHQQQPQPDCWYALLIDVAGEDEGIDTAGDGRDDPAGRLSNPRRDNTALTIVQIDLASLADPIIKSPTYRIALRLEWTGTKHSTLYGAIKELVITWTARYIVIDATGIGAGLASFLDKAFPGRVMPFVFNSSTKSKLGWDFLAVVETGRFKDYVEMDQERASFNLQLSNCLMEIQPGPEQRMKWGVPDGTRDSATGTLLHDDLIMSSALCAVLDGLEWSAGGPPVVVQAADPLAEMDKERF
jgi:hypothetical protein